MRIDNAVEANIHDATVLHYINEIKADYEHQIRQLKNNVVECQNKYIEMKERYDLLLYKRFVRSAEQLQADTRQQLLFTVEAEKPETVAEEETEHEMIKSYARKKPGRKGLDPNLPRKENFIDIPESEKTCTCGAKLTKIGEETCEKLHIIPQSIYVEKTIRPKYACRRCEGVDSEREAKTVRIAPV